MRRRWHPGAARPRAPHQFSAVLLALAASYGASAGEGDSRNIAGLAQIAAIPYVGADVEYLTDGKVPELENTLVFAAPLAPRLGGGTPLVYEFTYRKQVQVEGFGVFQYAARGGRRPADKFYFAIDADGDGKYEERVVSEPSAAAGKWMRYTLEVPRIVRGVRFVASEFDRSPGPNYGVPAVAEIEIRGRGITEEPKGSPDSAAFRLELEGPEHWSTVEDPATLHWGMQYPRAVVTNMWRFWSRANGYQALTSFRAFEYYKSLGANRIYIYPELTAALGESNDDLVFPADPINRRYALRRQEREDPWSRKGLFRFYPFPSEVVIGHRDNILQRFTRHAHDHNLGVFVNQRLLPYGVHGWDFPRVFKQDQYPCLLSSKFVWKSAATLYEEVAAAGVDGLFLGGDEFFYHGHPDYLQPHQPRCETPDTNCSASCAQLFEGRYPVHRLGSADLVTKAMWQEFEYNRLAELFGHLSTVVKNVNPSVITTTWFRPGEVKRMAYGVAYDAMGEAGGIDEMSSDPLWANDNFNGRLYVANEVKRLAGAARTRKASVVLQTTPFYDGRAFSRPVMIYGAALSAVMNGATGIGFYKDEYWLPPGQTPSGEIVKDVFHLIEALDREGLEDFSVPRGLALLYSRASEDVWALEHPRSTVAAGLPISYQNAVMEVLFRHGIPFDLYYLDQPESLDRLKEYKAVLVPFSHAVSDAALMKLEVAADRGTRILWMKGDAKRDQYGRPRAEMDLGSDFGDSFARNAPPLRTYSEFSVRLLEWLKRTAEAAIPMQCSANGDVECGLLTDEESYLLFVTNWSETSDRVRFRAKVNPGKYRIVGYGLKGVYRGSISGESVVTAERISDFQMEILPGAAYVLKFARQVN